MKKNKLLTTAVALSVLATAGIATVPVHAAETGSTGQAAVKVTHEGTQISATLPTSFDFTMHETGEVERTDYSSIVNESLAPIAISNVTIEEANGWEVKTFSTFDHKLAKVDTKFFAMEMAGYDITSKTLGQDIRAYYEAIPSGSSPGWRHAKKCDLDEVEAKFSLQSEAMTNQKVADITITVDWATADEITFYTHQ